MLQQTDNAIIEDSVKEAFEFLSKFKASPYEGLLITGKPGNGKTFICKHFASIQGYTDLYFNCCNEFQNLQSSQMMEKINSNRDQIVFFDELEYFSFQEVEKYYKFVEIINKCQNQNHKLVFITQSPEKLDLLPSKLPYNKALVIALPEANFKREFFKINFPQFLELGAMELGRLTDFYTIADLVVLTRNFQMEPLRRIMKAEFFNLIDGVYLVSQNPDELSIKLKNEEKIELIQGNKIQISLDQNDLRQIASQIRPSSY